MEAGDANFLEDASDDDGFSARWVFFCEGQEETFEEGCRLEEGLF